MAAEQPKRTRKKVTHDASGCLLCSRSHALMRVECVADALGLADITVYTGSGGTACLFEKRIQQGRSVRWLRSRVMAHLSARDEFGQCSGQCQEIVIAEPEPRRFEVVKTAS